MYRDTEVPTPNRIAEIRRSKNLTQRVIGIACGVAPNTVARWERGEVIPTRRHQRVLARILGVAVDDLALPIQGGSE
jgi:transcriptional regulator with XRE-family HTH domain